ncbi:hypothetical protein ACROYT_G019389 [Oculina patagonica]
MQHDVDYAVCAGKKDEKSCKHAADKKMVKALDATPKTKRQWGHALARNAVASKQKVGLGVGETVNKKIGQKIPGFQQAQDLGMLLTGAIGGDKKLLEKYWSGDIAKGAFNTKTAIRRGRVNIHRDQTIVERFNRTLAERLFGYQYSVELNLPSGQRSTAWVKRLPEVIAALNNEVTRLTGKKPSEAIKLKAVAAKPSTPYLRPVGKSEKKPPSSVYVRYLYQPGEYEGSGKRATDPIWSLKVFSLERAVMKPN